MYCSLAKYNGWKVHEENGESAQYAFDCCNENLCNNGTQWPELPDVPVLGQLHILHLFVAGNTCNGFGHIYVQIWELMTIYLC
jgi:hypothetical protein